MHCCVSAVFVQANHAYDDTLCKAVKPFLHVRLCALAPGIWKASLCVLGKCMPGATQCAKQCKGCYVWAVVRS
jgi:hypothetical protein